MNPPAPCLYACRTAHVRTRPFERRFSYRVSMLLLDVDAVAATASALRLFSYNRNAVFSFHDADHGDRTGAPLRPWVEAKLASIGVRLEGGAIRLLTFPRVFGRAFRPLSIYFGYGPDGRLRGVVYEVNNTFGETHCYAAAAAPDDRVHRHSAPKRFHVSPFFDVLGRYDFALSPPAARLSLVVKNIVDQETEHIASIVGRRCTLSDAALFAALARAPWAGIGVLGAIHWQALRIWLRGARYRPKPSPPLADLTQASHNKDKETGDAAASRVLDHAA